MSNVPAKFASALFLGVVAGAGSSALPLSTAYAADCLTEPKGETPQGKHWYYRSERGTGRQCWYLRGEDEKAARADTTSEAPTEKPAPRRTEAATSRSIADAHAEIGPRTRVPEAAPSVWPNPQAAAPAASNPVTTAPAANTAAPPPTSRWSGQTAGQAAAPPAPAASAQPDASLMIADTTDPNAATADPTQQDVPPPALAAAPVERNTGSLQKLLLVVAGALTLAGLTGSAVYRLGRRRKRNDWLRERSNWQSMENPRDPPWVAPQPAYAVPDLDEVAQAERHSEHSHAAEHSHAYESDESVESDETDENVEKIEDFLARLTRQLHAEIEGTPRAGRDARAAS